MPNTQVALSGNLTGDPELRITQSGAAVASFSLAVSDGTKEQPSTSFYDVSCWRSLAENVVETLSKGVRVNVIGTLKQRTWETDGNKRSKVEVVAEAVGPDLRWAICTIVKPERAQQSFPTPEEQGEYARAAKAAIENPGEYAPPAPAGEPF